MNKNVIIRHIQGEPSMEKVSSEYNIFNINDGLARVDKNACIPILIKAYNILRISVDGDYVQKIAITKRAISNLIQDIEQFSGKSIYKEDLDQDHLIIQLFNFSFLQVYKHLETRSGRALQSISQYVVSDYEKFTGIHGASSYSPIATDVNDVFLKLYLNEKKFYDLASQGINKRNRSFLKYVIRNTAFENIADNNLKKLDGLLRHYFLLFLTYEYIVEKSNKNSVLEDFFESSKVYAIPDCFLSSISNYKIHGIYNFNSPFPKGRNIPFPVSPFVHIEDRYFTCPPLIFNSLFSYTLQYLQGISFGDASLWEPVVGNAFEKKL